MAKQSYEQGRKKYNNFCQQLRHNVIKDIKKVLTTTDNDNDKKAYFKQRLETAFEDVLLQALNFISDVYGLDTNWIEISENVVLELTFSGDGENFYDRIDRHYSDYLKNNDQIMFLNAIDKIITTESRYIFNHALSSDLKNGALFCEIIGDNACGNCLDHLGGGKINPKLLNDLPPYHPNCECAIKYYFDINEDDMEEDSNIEE